MLAGLLFAIAEAEDRPGRLAATLPFGGLTLVEHQARALIAVGVSQVVVVVQRMTPELLGALSRIRRRGVSVDPVRSAVEAAARLHPLARVVMLADGLVATEERLAGLAVDAGDALLVLPLEVAPPDWERVGGGMAWAGAARLDATRLAELARMPAEYDIQSTLVRLSAQAGAAQVALPADAVRGGHGIETRAAGLTARGRTVLAGLVGGRPGWFDRWIVGPVAGRALPPLVERGASGTTVGGVGVALALGGIGAIVAGLAGVGAVLAMLACLALELGATLSGLRDERELERAQAIGLLVVPALAVLATGLGVLRTEGAVVAPTLAIAALIVGALAERAAPPGTRRRWWATPPAYLPVLALPALAGWPVAGLALVGLYAAATLAAGVEALRGLARL